MIANYISSVILTRNLPRVLVLFYDHRSFITLSTEGGSPGLVVMVDDSCSEGHGFESWHHILDGHFFTYIYVKIVMLD